MIRKRPLRISADVRAINPKMMLSVRMTFNPRR